MKFGNHDHAKISDADTDETSSGSLSWNVFMTPGIPVASKDFPPGIKEAYFQAMASTLIYGQSDAVLVDAFMTVKQASALADWIAASGKNLTTIYLTHGHGIIGLESELFLNDSQRLEQSRRPVP